MPPVSRPERFSSPAEILAGLPKEQRDAEIARLKPQERARLLYHWPFWARPNQLLPGGEWSTLVALAGRGFGKTRMGAEAVRDVACGPTPKSPGKCQRIAIVAETAKDLRETIARGPSGILAVHPPAFRPKYTEKGGFEWPNGATALVYNATEPEQLRGPQFDFAWCDELAKWRYASETWDNLSFGLRLGSNPRCVITTTGRNVKTLKEIIAESGTVVIRGSTYDNAANLSEKFMAKVRARYEGTRKGRQELWGDVLDDVPGALWTRDMLDRTRLKRSDKLPDMERIVVAIDPATADPNKRKGAEDNETAETGIVVAGLGVDGRGYVLDDLSCRLGPMGWARRALAGFDTYRGDRIVAEINQGGAMVEATIRAERPLVPYIGVHASRGKVTRAEPIAALYEQGRVSHVGGFSELEDQMCQFTPFGIMGEGLKDRTDALVWALTDLFPSMIAKARDEFEEEARPHPGSWGHPGSGWMGM
jgi:phage terminase large subunit-like protein